MQYSKPIRRLTSLARNSIPSHNYILQPTTPPKHLNSTIHLLSQPQNTPAQSTFHPIHRPHTKPCHPSQTHSTHTSTNYSLNRVKKVQRKHRAVLLRKSRMAMPKAEAATVVVIPNRCSFYRHSLQAPNQPNSCLNSPLPSHKASLPLHL